MTATLSERRYHPTESKYKGGAHEMYVTYDLEQKTRSDGSAIYPKVKRVYIAGHVKDWKAGRVQKKSGREVHGVRIELIHAPVQDAILAWIAGEDAQP